MRDLVSAVGLSPVQHGVAGSAVRLDFDLDSGGQVELALLDLPHRIPRLVVCTPAQFGCAFQCRFCGLMQTTHVRDLCPREMVELVDRTRTLGIEIFGLSGEDQGLQISFMGQGDPLANIDSVLEVVDHYLGAEDSISVGISTVGIPGKMQVLAAASKRVLTRIKLQISLHASLDPARWFLMPGTRGWSIEETIALAKDVALRSRRSVCLNYLLIDGVNDDDRCLTALASLADPAFFYVKLSTLNLVPGCSLASSPPQVFRRFAQTLHGRGIRVKLFQSAGTEVGAGCGQIGRLPAAVGQVERNPRTACVPQVTD